MKVFLSWSGGRSNYVANTLNEWIPRVIQNVKPWLSEEAIPKGVRWSPEIATALGETKFGVFCVTPENQGEAWINFEAGALSKSIVERTYVCVYLVELKKTDVVGPLSEFQLTNSDKEDTFRLVKTMNSAQGDGALSDPVLQDSFELRWPQLEAKLQTLPQSKGPVPETRQPREIQEETLEIVRRMEKSLVPLANQVSALQALRRTPAFGFGSTLLTRDLANRRLSEVLGQAGIQPGDKLLTLEDLLEDQGESTKNLEKK